MKESGIVPLLFPESEPTCLPHSWGGKGDPAPPPLSPITQDQAATIASSRMQALQSAQDFTDRLLRRALPGCGLDSLELDSHQAELP